MNKHDITLQVEALQSLLNHPGWQLVAQLATKQSDEAMKQMRNAKTNDELVRASITYMAIKDVVSAPELLLKVQLQNLEALNKQLKR